MKEYLIGKIKIQHQIAKFLVVQFGSAAMTRGMITVHILQFFTAFWNP
jgi:hypothetical protein